MQPGEAALWARMSAPDRRHAVGVARRVERALGAEAERPVLAAALLHDVGKVESGLRTYGRVVATPSAKVAGRDRKGGGEGKSVVGSVELGGRRILKKKKKDQ